MSELERILTKTGVLERSLKKLKLRIRIYEALLGFAAGFIIVYILRAIFP